MSAILRGFTRYSANDPQFPVNDRSLFTGKIHAIGGAERSWDLFFRYHKPGAAFDVQDLAVTAGQDVAFAVAIMRCGPDSSSSPKDKDGFPFRLTVGLRKIDGDWRIVHEHHSVPATD